MRVTVTFAVERPYPWADGELLAAIAKKADQIGGQLCGEGGHLTVVGVAIQESPR